MTHLGSSAYLGHIRSESTRFRAVLADCAPTASVPSCPEWDAADLLWHLGEVQHWWHHVIRNRPASPDDYRDPVRPTSYAGLLGFFDDWHGRFVDVLAAADPAEPAWSWSPNPQHHRVAFTYRRQAHEALIHRLDAELAAGTVTALPADLAADGVEETLDVMYGGLPDWGRFDPLPQFVEYRMSDADQSVWTQLGWFSGTDGTGVAHAEEPDQHVVADPGAPADLVITATADRLDGWLWHRHDDTGIAFTGDAGVREHALRVLRQPID